MGKLDVKDGKVTKKSGRDRQAAPGKEDQMPCAGWSKARVIYTCNHGCVPQAGHLIPYSQRQQISLHAPALRVLIPIY
jgi:hypothetical protein